MKHLLSALAFSILILSTQSQAAVLIEPVVGYNFGSKFTIGEGSDTDSYSGGSGPSFGGRLGFQQLGFQLGVDYLNSSIDMDDNDFDKNIDMSEWGAFVGFEFPIFLRVYAGYIFSATGETEVADTKVDLSKGSGYKAGLGFTALPFVDINLEYRAGTFDEIKSGGSESDDTADYKSIMIGLSIPIAI
jgi:opacity protein-like surface antigen